VGIGINFGKAYVGKVGTGDVNDFTALGDTVNTAARLQAHAKAGQVVVSESVYSHLTEVYPGVPAEKLELRGKEETFGVHVITPVVYAVAEYVRRHMSVISGVRFREAGKYLLEPERTELRVAYKNL